MKFLVLWSLEIRLLSSEMTKAILRQQDYGKKLQAEGKLDKRYHIVGGHGGAWIYDVASNEELDRLLAASPVYNLAHFTVYPLAEMRDDTPPPGD
jgi:muconolactone delta-isomerase